jgi:hypothetical protein
VDGNEGLDVGISSRFMHERGEEVRSCTTLFTHPVEPPLQNRPGAPAGTWPAPVAWSAKDLRGPRMIGAEMAMEIGVRAKHGEGVREMGVSRDTVRRYLRDEGAVRDKARPKRVAKPDPHEGHVAARLAAAAPGTIPGKVPLAEVRARGYAAGYTMVKDFGPGCVARRRPRPSRWCGSRPIRARRCRWTWRRCGGVATGCRSLWRPSVGAVRPRSSSSATSRWRR